MSYPRSGRIFFVRWPDSVWQRKFNLSRKMLADVRAHIENLPGDSGSSSGAEKHPEPLLSMSPHTARPPGVFFLEH